MHRNSYFVYGESNFTKQTEEERQTQEERQKQEAKCQSQEQIYMRMPKQKHEHKTCILERKKQTIEV